MAYPAGFSSDEDEFGGFISDDSFELESVQPREAIPEGVVPNELTAEQKLNNFYFAVSNGNLPAVIAALDEGIDINADLKDGWTPILLAAAIGSVDIVRELIRKGADVNASRDKYTALMAACSCPASTSPPSNCLEIVLQLIEKGANIEAITRTRKTAFMFAAGNGNVEIVSKLISCCNFKAEDNQGWNALFWAVQENKPEVIKVLLEAGLSFDKVDVRGNTPAYYAIAQENEEVIKMLPAPIEDTVMNITESYYQFKKLFENQTLDRPRFHRDVCCMLYGMKCEQLIEKFVDIDLLEFLSLNESRLKELDIRIPFQRDRILTGLYKFHNYLYKQKSIPIIPKESVYSTIDVGNALTAAIRQIIAMEASMKFISNYDNDIIDIKQLNTTIVRSKINKLKKTATALNKLTKKWDLENKDVDLITSNSYKFTPRWLKWLACLSVISITAFLAGKLQKHR